MNATTPQRAVQEFASIFHRLREQLYRVIVGHREALDEILVAFFAGGHVLIEGVPGTGKTLMVRTLGEASTCRSIASSSRSI